MEANPVETRRYDRESAEKVQIFECFVAYWLGGVCAWEWGGLDFPLPQTEGWECKGALPP